MKLRDFPILDLTKGLVTNKADNLLNSGELKNSLNYELDEQGRLKRRRGIQQWGTTQTGIIDDSVAVQINTAGSTPTIHHLMVDRASTSKVYRIDGSYTTAALTTTSTTIAVVSIGIFAATGTGEINGDIIAYGGKDGNS